MAGAQQAVDLVAHVHRHADSAALVGDGARDCLANPPGGIGAELVSAAPVELFGGADQADIALLDQIQERHAATDVFLGDGDDQARVGVDQVLARRHAVIDEQLELLHLFRGNVFAGKRLLARLAAALHALRQVDFLRRREQRHAADFLQVQADSVVCLNRLEQILVVPLVPLIVLVIVVVDQLLGTLVLAGHHGDSGVGQCSKQILKLIEVLFCVGEESEDILVRDVAFLTAKADELLFAAQLFDRNFFDGRSRHIDALEFSQRGH